jgi:hypothetical protein
VRAPFHAGGFFISPRAARVLSQAAQWRALSPGYPARPITANAIVLRTEVLSQRCIRSISWCPHHRASVGIPPASAGSGGCRGAYSRSCRRSRGRKSRLSRCRSPSSAPPCHDHFTMERDRRPRGAPAAPVAPWGTILRGLCCLNSEPGWRVAELARRKTNLTFSWVARLGMPGGPLTACPNRSLA